MVRALVAVGKEPKQEICRWNPDLVDAYTSVFDKAEGFEPTIQSPVVFHLHGYADDPSTMVLSEDDYLDFLVELARDPESAPSRRPDRRSVARPGPP
jgi:hypothetical protein